MEQGFYLVVGGAGVAGQSAIRAIRAAVPGATILATSSKAQREIPGATSVVPDIDLAAPDAVSTIVSQIDTPVSGLVFTPASGPVGFPVAEASDAQIATARAFSSAPLLDLLARLEPTLAIAFSTFHWLPDTHQAYGAMAAVKEELEALACRADGSLNVIRAGAFASHSAKALALAVYQQIRRGHQPELAAAWKGSARRFFEFFYERAWQGEAAAFGERFGTPHRATEPRDLEAAVGRVLAGSEAPLLNVIGDWQWTESSPTVANPPGAR